MKRFVLVVIILLLCFLLIYFFNQTAAYLFPSDADRTGELVKLVLSIVGGVCIIYSLYISNRRAQATEKSVRIQGEQINLSLKAQLDERFKNAIEHLGSDKEAIILGGIAELHQIAKEDCKKYAEVVFNILCSYIRTGTNRYKKKADDINSTAISTIINYLFKETYDNPYKAYCANLSASNLAGQYFKNCYLKDANFSQSYLYSIDDSVLDGADFGGSEIFGSSFQNNSWKGVKLFHAKLSHVKLTNVDFSPSTAQKENLFAPYCFNCRFENVKFDNLDVYGAFFIGCIFVNCSFKNSTIGDCYFYCCSFDNVQILEANMISIVDFSASVFWKVRIGYSRGDIILKGCSIEKTSNIFIPIEEQLQKLKKTKSTAKNLDFLSDLPSNYIYGELSEIDCKKILDKYSELKNSNTFPLKSDINNE